MSNIAKNTMYLTLNRIVPPVLGFLLIVAVSRTSTVLLGNYSVLTVIYFVVQTLPFLGLTPFIMKVMAQTHSKIGVYSGSAMVLAMLVAAGMVFLMPLIKNWMNFTGEMERAVEIIVYTMFPCIITYTFELVFVSVEKPKIIGVAVVVESVFRLFASIIILKYGFGLVELFLVVLAGKVFTSIVYGFRYFSMRKRFGRFGIAAGVINDYLKNTPVYLLNSILFLIISRSDFIVLAKYVSAEEIGFYSVGYKILDFGILFFTAFVGTIYPRLSRLANKANESEAFSICFLKSLKMIMLIVVPCCFLCYVNAPFFVSLLFPKQHPQAASILQVLIFCILFTSVRLLTSGILFSVTKPQKDLAALGVSSVAYVVLLLLFVPKYGIAGAAYACLLEAVIQLATRLLFVRKYMPQKLVVKEKIVEFIVWSILYSFGVIGISMLLNNRYFLLASGAVFTFVLLFVVVKKGIFGKNDLDYFGLKLMLK